MGDLPAVECEFDPCPHHMFSRCPVCRREMYVPAVWAFSHGEVTCGCGSFITPVPRPRPAPAQTTGRDGDE